MNADFLLKSLAAKPCAEPIDAVKWLYQSEFGCGHMLPPEAECAARIAQETAQTAQTDAEPSFEPLGDGLCRLNLKHPLTRALPPERIARMMRVTDGGVRGASAGFEAKLALLSSLTARDGSEGAAFPCERTPAVDAGDECCAMDGQTASALPASDKLADPATRGGLFQTTAPMSIPPMGEPARLPKDVPLRLPFTAQALAETLQAFHTAPPSPPSHSERYRRAYAPAYRVVLRRFGEALPALARVEAQLAAHGRAVLVLDGDCASGKTTLASLLSQLYNCNVIHMDDFFLPFPMRSPARMAEAGGNIHYERFAEQVLGGLSSGGPFPYDAFNCHTGEQRTVAVVPAPVTIIEGSYSLHPRFQAAYNSLEAVRVLMRVDDAEQRRRILARNGQAMLTRFVNEWIPLEKRYFQAYHSAQAGTLTLWSVRHPEDEASGEADVP